jgi:hypothetical protein
MDDLIKSLKAHLYDRLTSPLLSSVLIAWAAWNYRLFVVLLSNLDVQKKFDYIDTILYPTLGDIFARGTIYPLLSALFLIYVYPIPARRVYEYVRSEQKKLKEIQQRIEDETPITVEQARELRTAIRKADSDFEREIGERDAIILKLRQEISKLEADATQDDGNSAPLDTADIPVDVRLAELGQRLTQPQITILNEIAQAPDGLEISLARASAGSNPVVRQFNIDELLRFKLIAVVRPLRGKPVYRATAAGRAFLVHELGPSVA